LEDSKGIAFGAKVAFFDLGDSSGNLYTPSNLETGLFPSAYSTGARIHSNSWGSTSTYSYADEDLQVDSYAYDNTDFLILFAAGNDGEYGEATTITSPSQSKNAMTIGASETGRFPTSPDMNTNPSYVASFSSSGPTSDGRIKPDVVAPGYHIVSASAVGYSSSSPTCEVYSTQGTSMATPGVAGAAALVRDYLTSSVFSDHALAVSDDIDWTCLPGYQSCETGLSLDGGAVSSLVKAMLIHGTAAMTYWDAEDSSGNGYLEALSGPPDFYQGFGRIDLSGSIYSSDSIPSAGGLSLWVTDDGSISSSTTVSYTFHLISTAEPLKATLVWCDPPNSVGASSQLLHDLDLTITDDTTSTTYYSNGNSGNSDEDNNVEKVWISSPSSIGDYTITVTSSVLTESSTQAYALVISGVGYYIESGYTWTVIEAGEIVPSPLPSITPLPTYPPSPAPTQKPTIVPSPQPTISPLPTNTPTPNPTPVPTISHMPTSVPSIIPSPGPTQSPTEEESDKDIVSILKQYLIIIAILVVVVVFCISFFILRCCCGMGKSEGSSSRRAQRRQQQHQAIEMNPSHVQRLSKNASNL